MNLARSNAARLTADATLCLKEGRYASAAALAVLAIEEAGKAAVLRELAVVTSEEDLKAAWRAYRSHTSKNRLGGLLDALKSGARRLEDFAPLFAGDAEHPALLDAVKQISFYTDCYGDAHWSNPENVVDEQLASELVMIAAVLSKARPVSEREIELWVDLIGPVWKRNPAWMQRALVAWYAAMQKEGLLPPGCNEMERFIEEGVGERGSEPSREV